MNVCINSNSFDYFGFFLVLSLFILFAGFLYSATRSKLVNLSQASLFYFIVILFAITGSKLFTVSFEEWRLFFVQGIFPSTTSLSVSGGLFFMFIGIVFSKWLMSLKYSLIDHFALILPIAMATQRFGCFFSGCCHGIPTKSDFGVKYVENTVAHINSAWHGYVSNFNQLTPTLHPVQIYLVIVGLISFFILLKVKKYFFVNGNLFLFSIFLFLCGKTITEFFRDPLTHKTSGKIINGLMINQWLTISFATLIIVLIFVRKKWTKPSSVNIIHGKISKHRNIFILLFFLLFLFFSKNWYSKLEFTCLLLFFSFNLLNLIIEFILNDQKHLYKLRVASIILFVFSFLPITAQIAYNNIKDSSPEKYSELTIGGSLANEMSHYHVSATVNPQTCGDPSYTYPTEYSHTARWLGASYAQHFKYGNFNSLHYRISGSAGFDFSDDPKHIDGRRGGDNLYDFTLSGTIERKIFAIEAGAHFGYFRSLDIKTGHKEFSKSAGHPGELILPMARVRIGYTPIIYFDGRAGMTEMGINGQIYPIVVGIGSGFRNNNGSNLHMGIDVINQSFDAGGKYLSKNGKWACSLNFNLGAHQMAFLSISKYFNVKPLKQADPFE